MTDRDEERRAIVAAFAELLDVDLHASTADVEVVVAAVGEFQPFRDAVLRHGRELVNDVIRPLMTLMAGLGVPPERIAQVVAEWLRGVGNGYLEVANSIDPPQEDQP